MSSRRVKMKVCLIGDGGVGKTSLIRRFVYNEFDERYLYTLGTNVSKKEVILQDSQGGTVEASMMIWDIMGQRTFRPLFIEAYFEGTDGALAVCDVTQRETLVNLADWIDSMSRITGPVPTLILANKVDLTDQIVVSEEMLSFFDREYGVSHLMTSAKTGQNVENAFRKLAELILSKSRDSVGEEPSLADSPTVVL